MVFEQVFAEKRALQLYGQGLVLETDGELDRALEQYRMAVQVKADFALGHLALGHLLGLLGRYPEATNSLEKSLSLEESPMAYFNLGEIAQLQSRPGDALQFFEKAFDLAPQEPLILKAAANGYLRVGEYGKAGKMLLMLLEIDGENPDTQEMVDRYNRYREFEQPFGEAGSGHPVTKTRIYADYGVICLGTDFDDGLEIPEYFLHNFSFKGIAVTLRRLAGLVTYLGVPISTIIPVDEESKPLAWAVAKLLDAVVKDPGQVTRFEQVLLVQAVDRNGLAYRQALLEVGQRAGGLVGFILGVRNLEEFPRGQRPDIIGVEAPVSVPWRLVEEFSRWQSEGEGDDRKLVVIDEFVDVRSPEDIALEIQAELEDLGEEKLQAQVDWYNKKHSRVNLLLRLKGVNLNRNRGTG